MFDRITHSLILSGKINSQFVNSVLLHYFYFLHTISVDIYFLANRPFPELHFFYYFITGFFSSHSLRHYIGMIPTKLCHSLLPQDVVFAYLLWTYVTICSCIDDRCLFWSGAPEIYLEILYKI